ncbi:MFS general substrate transporter [Thelephora ganbajun]|uniref:MFS general substrate transporter n=1 Tax=Thelephora ganbajun TaxID=370292 RepID=A0ACB6ZQV2_THEGA|nr:MFS general substrate transporter [Thelephora ganbajun]
MSSASNSHNRDRTKHHQTLSIVEREEEEQGLLDDGLGLDTIQVHEAHLWRYQRKAKWKARLVRAVPLLCACSLSIGSHYATYILGPLKSRLSREMGTSNTEFGLFLAALSSSGTWTPLVGGVMTARLGTTVSSIIATGTVFLGQALLLIGHLNNEVWLMTLGMFVFGLGQGPLSVAQETIIVRFFKSHGLGLSLALGLVAGKGASFISARTSYPLSQWSPNAPFYVSAGTTGFSFVINLVYVFISEWLIREAGAAPEDSELRAEARRRSVVSMTEAQVIQQVADKKRFKVREVFKLGDVVWAYVALNVLFGSIWYPFVHLAPNIFERRFGLTELEASTSAAYLLSGSVLLYPICGVIVDRVKRGSIVLQLMTVASVLTLLCFFWMALPPTRTHTPWPAIICFGAAMGFAPLLLVVIVPRIVPLEYISTTLGLHKSLEHVGTTVTQTFSGLWLDFEKKEGKTGSLTVVPGENEPRLQWLLNGFLLINVLHLVAIWGLGYLNERKHTAQKEAAVQNEGEVEDEGPQDAPGSASGIERPSLSLDLSPQSASDRTSASDHATSPPLHPRDAPSVYKSYGTHLRPRKSQQDTVLTGATTPAEVRRGKIFASLSAAAVVFALVLFLVTSFIKIRSRREREGHS